MPMRDVEPSPEPSVIERALRGLHGKASMRRFSLVSAHQGGDHPIRELRVFKDVRGRAHWHLVTVGFSEPAGRWPGHRFELTFRLACARADKDPPSWAMDLLQNLGRRAYRTGQVFAVGDHLDLQGPIAIGRDTRLQAIAFAQDPKLKPAAGPEGPIEFLQVVGVTPDELDLTKDWHASGLLEVFATREPALITDLSRESMLADPKLVSRIRARAAREGSSMREINTPLVQWSRQRGGRKVDLKIGAVVVEDVRRLLLGRIGHGRPFSLVGPGAQVRFAPASSPGFKVAREGLEILLSEKASAQLHGTLRPERGHYEVEELEGLTVTVEPVEITDAKGNVVRVVG